MQPGPGGYPGAPAPYNPYAQQQQGQPGALRPPVAAAAPSSSALPALRAPAPADPSSLLLQVPARRWRGPEATRRSSPACDRPARPPPRPPGPWVGLGACGSAIGGIRSTGGGLPAAAAPYLAAAAATRRASRCLLLPPVRRVCAAAHARRRKRLPWSHAAWSQTAAAHRRRRASTGGSRCDPWACGSASACSFGVHSARCCLAANCECLHAL